MGMLDRFKASPKKNKPRGPTRSSKERLDADEYRFRQKLRTEDPEAYRDFMFSRLKITPRKPVAPDDPLSITFKTIEKMRVAGFIDDPKTAGIDDENGIKNILLGLANTQGGASLMTLLGAKMAGMSPEQLAYQGQQPQADQPALNAASPVAELPAPQAQGEAQQQQEPQMSVISMWALSQLKGKTPEQAIAWFKSLNFPQLNNFLEQLRNTPNEGVPALMQNMVVQMPDLRGVFQWLQANPQWFFDLVQLVRGNSAAPTVSSNGKAGKVKASHGL